jgi:hypothetical protein
LHWEAHAERLAGVCAVPAGPDQHAEIEQDGREQEEGDTAAEQETRAAYNAILESVAATGG